LTGAVASQMVTEAPKGSLRLVGNQPSSAMAQESLTVRLTSRTGTKVGHSDPAVACGSAVDQRIKGTPGITGLSSPRVHIDGKVWHLDVGSSHPGAEAGPKGWAVRRETVRSLSAAAGRSLRKAIPSTRGPGWTQLSCASCPAKGTAG
jgi:hypothetical protein